MVPDTLSAVDSLIVNVSFPTLGSRWSPWDVWRDVNRLVSER
jgi:hypothetical protein